jgi:hypothetical protein
MTCISSCTAGGGAAITLLAFIFDLALFFLAKSRLNSVQGGSATMGNAIWLTLVAWILLFFSGCFYGLGRCCIRRRPRDMGRSDREGSGWSTGPTYEEQMRLDAVKAEADRKARLKQGELGLPAFPEHDQTQPLTLDSEDDIPQNVPYRDTAYAAAPPGTRAVDEYYNQPGNNAYPPKRQPTALSDRTQHTGYIHSQQTSTYAPSTYGGASAVSTGPAVASGYLSPDHTGYQDGQYPSQANSRYGHEQSPSNVGRRQPTVNADYAQNTYSPCRSSPFVLSSFLPLTEIVTQTTLCLLGLRRTFPARIPSRRTAAQHNSHSIPTHTTPQRRYPNPDDPLCIHHQNQPHHTIPRKPKGSSHRHDLTPSVVVAMATTLCLQCMIPSQARVSYHTQAVRQTRTVFIRA